MRKKNEGDSNAGVLHRLDIFYSASVLDMFSVPAPVSAASLLCVVSVSDNILLQYLHWLLAASSKSDPIV